LWDSSTRTPFPEPPTFLVCLRRFCRQASRTVAWEDRRRRNIHQPIYGRPSPGVSTPCTELCLSHTAIFGIDLLSAMVSGVYSLQSVPPSNIDILRIGFFQKKYPNGTFQFTDPINCSPNDTQYETRPCSLQGSNVNGFYESSSWEYSWFVPHDTAQLVTLMGGNVR
jgi:hypothetical protein